MVVHQKLHPTHVTELVILRLHYLIAFSQDIIYIPWFFGRVHLANEVIDPQDEGAYHGEETEKVTSVG